MVRLFSLLVVAVLGLLALVAGPAQAQMIGEDSAVGDVITVPFRPIGAVFDARRGPAGEDPSGSVNWFDRGLEARGPVTCLAVTGNRATIGFENQGSLGLAKGGLLLVEDNGTPGAGRDNMTLELVPDPPRTCPPNDVVYTAFDTVTSGELTVHDAAATPTSKDQCKNGGWRDFPQFKNQGDCVSFAATKGKNAPANSP
jgi:hypothetical protein